LLTGSVAADDAEKDADVDILVIVAEGRIALAFLVLAPLSRVVSRRIFCPNYYLSQSHLSVPRHDRYVARELLQAQPVCGELLILAEGDVRVEAC
jgi:predicted nucleotidyltransferase